MVLSLERGKVDGKSRGGAECMMVGRRRSRRALRSGMYGWMQSRGWAYKEAGVGGR